MTAPAEPDLDLSHLLTEAAVPPGGAANAVRAARRRHVARRVAAGGAALVVVAVVAVTVVESRGGDRTVRTAAPAVTSTLLSTADVKRVLPEMVPKTFRNGSDIASATPAELRISTPPPRSGLTRQWTWRGERSVQGPLPDRVWMVSATVLEFGDEQSASRFLAAVPRDMQMTSFNGIPGAIEMLPPAPRGGAVVSFPRGRFVYSIIAVYGGNHADELHQLALRQAQLAGSALTSCPVSAPLTGVGDGLPQEGQTTLEHVRETMTRYEPIIRRDFAGVVSLSVEPRNGEVWRGKRGDFTVHRVQDYWIVVHVDSPVACPSAPAAFHSYDGVPLHFVVG